MNTYSRIRAWAADRGFRPSPSAVLTKASRPPWAFAIFVFLSCGGCTSYHETSLHHIEAHPDKFIDKKVRVHYAGTGDSTVVNSRTARERSSKTILVAPDSVVSLSVAAIKYPVLSGSTYFEPKLYGTAAPGFPLQVDVTGSRKVEVYGFSAGKTVLLLGGIALVAAAVYSGVKKASEDAFGDFWAPIFGGTGSHRSVAPSPQHQ